jgi:hypothetical protein
MEDHLATAWARGHLFIYLFITGFEQLLWKTQLKTDYKWLLPSELEVSVTIHCVGSCCFHIKSQILMEEETVPRPRHLNRIPGYLHRPPSRNVLMQSSQALTCGETRKNGYVFPDPMRSIHLPSPVNQVEINKYNPVHW